MLVVSLAAGTAGASRRGSAAWPLESRGILMPTLVGPEVIDKELVAWDQFRAAFLRGDRERPSLPTSEAHPPLHLALAAAAVRACLIFLAALARLLGPRSLQLWAAGRVLTLDRLSLEPARCGLNRAYTRLGLAKLAAGDQLSAIACLRNSWHVHPCPHSTSFGLTPPCGAP